MQPRDYHAGASVTQQGILKGGVSLYGWPPVWLVWNQLYDYWQFCFYLQNRLIQTSQTGGQLYRDTSPFSIPWTQGTKVFQPCRQAEQCRRWFWVNTAASRPWCGQSPLVRYHLKDHLHWRQLFAKLPAIATVAVLALASLRPVL